MLHNIEDLESINELNMVVNLFKDIDSNDFNDIALKVFKQKSSKIKKDKLIRQK